MTSLVRLEALNVASAAEFVSALDGVFEHAPFVAEGAASQRPFATVAALHQAMIHVVASAPEVARIAFFARHPELAAKALPRDLTAESAAEQAGLGMSAVADGETLPALNRAYREKFGFPFIVCVGRHTAPDVLRRLRARLDHGRDQELETTLTEVGHITLIRLLSKVSGPGAPPVAGHLSTHVLDLQSGRAAEGLGLTLLQEGREVASARTDADGRVAAGDLLPPGPLREGHYEFQFDVGAYFAGRGLDTLYDKVPLRFVIGSATGRYHIPLLLSPFGYSTYRGS